MTRPRLPAALALAALLLAPLPAGAQAPTASATPPPIFASNWRRIDVRRAMSVYVATNAVALDPTARRVWLRLEFDATQPANDVASAYTRVMLLTDVVCGTGLPGRAVGDVRTWALLYYGASGARVGEQRSANVAWDAVGESPYTPWVAQICAAPVTSVPSTPPTSIGAAATARICSATDVRRTIALGDTVRSALDVSDCVRSTSDRSFAEYYRLELRGTTVVQFDFTSTEFDTHLAVLDAETGRSVGSGSSSAASRNARLIDTLPAGTYHVVANSFLAGEKGRFTLSVRRLGGASVATAGGTPAILSGGTPAATSGGTAGTASRSCTSADSRRTLAVGDSVRGTLDATDCVYNSAGAYAEYYRVDVAAPTIVRFDLMSSAFDAFLLVYGAAGGSPGTSTDGGGAGTDARLFFSLRPGSHWIIVKANERGQSGSYLLTLSAVATPAASTATPPALAPPCAITDVRESLQLGEVRRGALERSTCMQRESRAVSYRLEVASSARVVLDLVSTVLDPFLTVYDARGTEVARDDDGGEGRNARVEHLFAPGVYYVVARGYGKEQSGEFTLSAR